MLMRLRSLWPFVLVLALVTVTLILGDAGDAFAKKKDGDKTVALFPFIERDAPDQEITEFVYTLLSKASALIKDLTVITGPKLKKKLRKDPAKLVGLCGSNLKCIAKLGKKAKAEESMIAMVSPADEGGVKISFLVVDTKTKGIARKEALVFASKDDVKAVLGGAFYSLFGITDPGFLEVQGIGPATLVRAAGKIVGKGPGPHMVPPGRHEVEVGDFKDMVMIVPDATKTIEVKDTGVESEPPPEPPPAPGPMVASAATAPETKAEAPPPAVESTPVASAKSPPKINLEDEELEELASIPPDGTNSESPPIDVAASGETTTDSAEADAEGIDGGGTTDIAALDGDADGLDLALAPLPPPAKRGLSPGILTWVGAGVGGIGILVGGIGGGVTGSEALSLRSGITKSTHTQIAAKSQGAQAEGMAGTSTALFIVGGIVAALGAAITAVDLLVLQPKATVSVGDGEAMVTAGFDF